MFEMVTFDHWTWAILAIALISIEILAPGVAFLWLGLAAVVMALLVGLFPDMNVALQGSIFAVLAILAVLGGRRLIRRNPISSKDMLLNRRGAQYVGRVFHLEMAIVNGRGKVQVDDTTWVVEGPDLPVGSRVRVVAVEHVNLKVEPAED